MPACDQRISATDCPRAPARGPAPRPPALPAGGHYQREREILVLVNTTHPEKDREPVCYGFGSSEVRRARARRVTGNQLHDSNTPKGVLVNTPSPKLQAPPASHTRAIACHARATRARHSRPSIHSRLDVANVLIHPLVFAERFKAPARTEVIHCPSLAGGNGFRTAQTRRTSRGEQRPRL